MLRDGKADLHKGTLTGIHQATQLISMMVGREIKDMYPKTAASHELGAEPCCAWKTLRLKRPGLPADAPEHLLHAAQGRGAGHRGLWWVPAGASSFEIAVRPAPESTPRRHSAIEGKKVVHPKAPGRHRAGHLVCHRGPEGQGAGAAALHRREHVAADAEGVLEAGLHERRGGAPELARAADEGDAHQGVRVYYTACETLSGGNQQKVVLGRWLITNPRILLLDEPTRGIDVGAKAEIYQLISDLAGQGMGVIVISSELPEVIGISDRILTFCEGRITGVFNREDATQEKLLDAATLREEDAI